MASRSLPAGENIVVLGIKPTRPETGYGYIEAAAPANGGALRVRRFTEKPNADERPSFSPPAIITGTAACSFGARAPWPTPCASTCPIPPPILEKIAASYGTRKFAETFRKLYPKCENISVDYAVLEPRSAKGEDASNIFCIPADFGWNDLGSWTALHEHRTAKEKTPRRQCPGRIEGIFTLDAAGNYVHAPGKFVAAVGVKDLVVVETDDALLITTRERAQDVGKVVKYLDEKKLRN